MNDWIHRPRAPFFDFDQKFLVGFAGISRNRVYEGLNLKLGFGGWNFLDGFLSLGVGEREMET